MDWDWEEFGPPLMEEEFSDSDQNQTSCTRFSFKNVSTATSFWCLLVCDDFQSLHFLTRGGLRKGSENCNILKSTQEIQVFIKI